MNNISKFWDNQQKLLIPTGYGKRKINLQMIPLRRPLKRFYIQRLNTFHNSKYFVNKNKC